MLQVAFFLSHLLCSNHCSEPSSSISARPLVPLWAAPTSPSRYCLSSASARMHMHQAYMGVHGYKLAPQVTKGVAVPSAKRAILQGHHLHWKDYGLRQPCHCLAFLMSMCVHDDNYGRQCKPYSCTRHGVYLISLAKCSHQRCVFTLSRTLQQMKVLKKIGALVGNLGSLETA